MREQVAKLRDRFDIAIDFQGLLKSGLVAKATNAPRRIGFASEELREKASRIFLTEQVSTASARHIIDKNLVLASSILPASAVCSSTQDYEFPIAVSPEDEQYIAEQVIARADSFAILNPGGGWWTKLWSVERFGKLADLLWSSYGISSLVTYGPGEEALAEGVRKASVSGKALPVSLSLKGFYSLARGAKVYVGGDTGPTHIAVAAGAPIVGLFGPTEWWRNGSPRPEDICVERTDIDCRVDCHRRACSKWICMDIEVGRVLEAVDRRMAHNDAQTS